MKSAKSLVIVFCLAVLNTIGVAHGHARKVPHTASDDSAVLGDWRGESICVVRESACRDEDSPCITSLSWTKDLAGFL